MANPMQSLKADPIISQLWRRLSVGCQDPAWLRRAGWWALLIAFFLRVFWALLVPVIPLSDSNAYDVFAQNIASGYCYCWKPGESTAFWPVGTSAVYALIYSVIGHTYIPIVVLNIMVGLGTIALAMSLARRWLGPVPAVLTGWILAIWPEMIQFTTILASEMLFNVCVLAAFWMASMPKWKWGTRSVACRCCLGSRFIYPTGRPVASAVVVFAGGIVSTAVRKGQCGLCSILLGHDYLDLALVAA